MNVPVAPRYTEPQQQYRAPDGDPKESTGLMAIVAQYQSILILLVIVIIIVGLLWLVNSRTGTTTSQSPAVTHPKTSNSSTNTASGGAVNNVNSAQHNDTPDEELPTPSVANKPKPSTRKPPPDFLALQRKNKTREALTAGTVVEHNDSEILQLMQDTPGEPEDAGEEVDEEGVAEATE